MTLNIPNLDRLISHLEGLPEEKFDMRYVFTEDGHPTGAIVDQHDCGTAACIAGACAWVSATSHRRYWNVQAAADFIGLGDADDTPAHNLFCPDGFKEGSTRYPLSRAIRTLKHMRSEYLRTGQVVVDWDAPEPEAKPAWTAPKAVEQTKPALPAEIVRFLRPADLEVVS